MSGLVSRFVWIWPTWDAQMTANATPYRSQTVELGWWTLPDSGTPDFCRCDNDDDAAMGVRIRRCSYTNETTDDEAPMAADVCKIQTTYASEYISEDLAVEKLSATHHDWIDGQSGIVIDVDEDFFGCESPADQLVGRMGAGPSAWRNVERIDAALSEFLCPSTAVDESAADRFARRLVGFVNDVCRRRHRRRHGVRCRPPSFDGVVTSAFVSLPFMFCGKDLGQIKAAWASLAIVLSGIPAAQLRAVHDVGFCLNTAPRTYDFRRRPTVGDFSVCRGANEPNSTLVFLHTPSATQLDSQLRAFDRLVALLLRQSAAMDGRRVGHRQLVTVSRSVRDGYTPRSLAGVIEAGILSALQRQKRGGSLTVVYDRDLLNGSAGWTNRL